MSAPAKQWLSASEIAGLPGCPADAANVARSAARLGWSFQTETRRGKPFKIYDQATLPPEAQAELARRAAAAEAERNARLGIASDATAEHYRRIREEQLAASVKIAPHAQRRAEARAAILRARDAFRAANPSLRKRAINEAFADAFNAGQIPVDTRGVRVERLSTATLFRWERQAADGWQSLGGGYGKRAGQTKIDGHPELVSMILGELAADPGVKPVRVAQRAKARFTDAPSESAIRAWISRWQRNNPGLWAHLRDPDAARGSHMPAVGSRSAAIVRLNQLWELDSSPADIILADGKRYTLVAAIDVYSRRARVVLAPQSNSREVGQVLRRMILDFGVPEAVLTDNGQDYVSAQTRALLGGLEIEHRRAPPFRGDFKPHVERFFRTLQHELIELLPGYKGHSVAEAKAIRSRRAFSERLGTDDRELLRASLTPDELVVRINEWLTCNYEIRPHSGLDGQTPRQVAEEWPGEVRRIQNERALDILLQPLVKPHCISKKGLHIDNATFASEHGEHGSMLGRWVHIRRDPSDVGRIWCFDEGGRYLFTAVCAARTGVSLDELAAKAMADYRRVRKEQMAELRALKREALKSDRAAELNAAAMAASHKILPLRQPEERAETYTTPALDGAADLIAAQLATPEPIPEATLSAGCAAIHALDESRRRQRELAEQRQREDQAAIDRWIGLAATPREERSDRDQRWFERMASSDPVIRDHIDRVRPDLQHLLALASAGLA